MGERERCLAAGMDDYIAKPFTTQQLYQALLAAVPAPAEPPATVSVEPASAGPAELPPPTAPTPEELFNPARLDQLCADLDSVSVAGMVEDFSREFPARLVEIHRLHTEGKWRELERAAHSLKGLTAMFGFEKVSAQFRAIEDAAEAADTGKVTAAVANLDEVANAAAQRLRGWLENIRGRMEREGEVSSAQSPHGPA